MISQKLDQNGESKFVVIYQAKVKPHHPHPTTTNPSLLPPLSPLTIHHVYSADMSALTAIK